MALPTLSVEARPASRDDAVWRLQAFGGFTLDDGDAPPIRLRSRAAMLLLARLALAPQVLHAREQLVDLLWPDAPDAAGRNRLRQTLSYLRAVLEPPGGPTVLIADRRHVRVVPGGLWCDAVAFEQSLAAGRHGEARALYRGELLPAFYDDWVHTERLRLQALFARLPDAPAATVIAAPAERGPSLDTQPALPPEPVVALPMARSARLPQYLTRAMGTDVSGTRLQALVREHRLVTVLGPGGCGKTRLAVEVAGLFARGPEAGSAARFGRVLFASLVHCVSEAELLDRLLLTLQLRADGDAMDRLVGALDGPPALVVLDNAEQLDEPAGACVARLVEALPRVHWLVTSRRPLESDGEQRFVLEPLALPAADASLAEAAMNPAIALFVDRARAHRPEFHVTAGQREGLIGLVRWLDGLPLAIELAASRSRTLLPAQMLALLQAHRSAPDEHAAALDWLSRRGGRSAQDARQASMLATIGWSWGLLSPELQRIVLAIGLLPAGAHAATVRALVAPEAPPFTVQAQLDQLVSHSMVQYRAAADGGVRFSVTEPVREFAASQLDGAAARVLRAALRGWALRWAEGLPATPPLPLVREELPNLLTALAAAVTDGCGDDALRLVLGLQSSWGEIAVPASAIALLEQALALPGLDPSLQAGGFALAGWSAYEVGQREAATAHVERALAIDMADPRQRVMVLHRAARIRWRVARDAAGARALLREALPLAEANGWHSSHAALLSLEAHLCAVVDNDPAGAEALNRRAVALCWLTGNAHLINAHRYNLATNDHLMGRHAAVLPELKALAAEGRALEDWNLVAGALDVMGSSLLAMRRWQEACDATRESLAVAWRAGDPLATVFALWNIAPALARLRKPVLAAQTMAFAEVCWRKRFGDLDGSDRRDLRRLRRFVRCQLSVREMEAAWQTGGRHTWAEAVQGVLDAVPERRAL